MNRTLTLIVLSLTMLTGWALWHVTHGGMWLAAARGGVPEAALPASFTGNAAAGATSITPSLAPFADGAACTSFTNRTTANGLGSHEVRGVYVAGSTIYAATYGGLSISTDGGATFGNRTTAQGLGDNRVNSVFVVGNTVYAATEGGLSISYDGGATFSNRTTAQGLGDNYVACLYVVGNTVYAGTLRGLSISTDGGNNFTTSLGDATGYFVSGIHVEGNTIYVTSELYGLFISIDGGASYTQKTTADGLASNRIFGIYAAGATIYVATEGGLSLTTDGGASFSNRLLGSTIRSVYALGNTVYAATTVAGLSLSTDGGASFTNITTAQGLGNNKVLGVYATSTGIYAATDGGLSLCPPPPPVAAITVSGNNNLIVYGSTTPSITNDTDFSRAYLDIGSSLRTFTIANRGSAALALTGTPDKVVINGAHASDFTVTTQPSSPLADGGSTTFQITFSPSAIGTRTATVSIANNDATKNPYTFAIQGTGGVPAMAVSGYNNVIANGSLTPSTGDGTDFGSRAIGIVALVRDFTISNTGGVQLALTGTPKVTLSGTNAADFSVAVQPESPVAPINGQTTFWVHFAPTATGLRTATISIANDDPTKNPYTFAIQGTGLPRPADPICTNFTSRLSEDTYGVFAQGDSIYVGGRNGLHISTDGGASFSTKTMAQGLGANWVHQVFAQGNTIYAATGDGSLGPGGTLFGGLSTSTDGGASFSNRGFGGFDRDFTLSVNAVGTRIYVGTFGNFNLSTDGGASFVQKLGPTLSSYDVYAQGSMVYVATFRGLYISDNGGESFFRFVDAFPTFENYEPTGVCAQGNSIYVATGVGLFISTDGGVSFSKRTTAQGLGDDVVNEVYAVDNTIYAATEGGLSISTDGGSNFLNYGLGQAVNDVYATATGIYAATGGGLSFCKVSACPTVTGTMGSGGTICATQSANVTVTVSGGVAPYTVTLTNGGGTQTGNGPTFTFPVTPGATTSYQVAAASHDSNNCPITNSGTATVTVSQLPTTANAGLDQTVCGTSTMLAANAPSVGTGAWTIVSGTGGSVTTPASPTSAFTGVAGTSYTLRWTISNATCAASTDNVVIYFNTPPTLTYAAAGVSQGDSTTINPLTGPSDDGSITNIVVQSVTPAFGGTIAVNNVSGQVTVSNAAPPGSYSVGIRATDNCGAIREATFTLTVSCQTLTVTNPATATGTAGTMFSQSFSQAGGVGAVTFSTMSTLPNGLTLASNGTLSGTLTQTGTFPIVVKATDSNNCMGTGTTYTLVIGCPIAATLPTTLPSGTGGTSYSASVTASPSGTYAYGVSAGSLPNGLSLNEMTGALTGTPMVASTFNFTITATRFGSCPASQAYTVTIACPRTINLLPQQPQVFTTNGTFTSLPVATVDRLYTTTISATPTGGSYTFSLIPSPQNLPNGLTLNQSTGVIEGAATVVGIYKFRIQATGFGACSSSRLYLLQVNEPTKLAAKANQVDFDGDDKSDLWSYRADDGRWHIQRSSDQKLVSARLGSLNETAVPADYDGDGKTDVAVFNAATQRWLILQSRDGAIRKERLGEADAQPFPADFDGDGKADLAVRLATGEWQVRQSDSGELLGFALGEAEDTAIVGDFDGDGLTDAAVYRASDKRVLIRRNSDGATLAVRLPYAEGIPMVADFDGDGKAEMAFWSAAKATLSFKRSSDQQEQQLTLNSQLWLLGDYDGDGRSDCASWQALGWHMRLSSRHCERP